MVRYNLLKETKKAFKELQFVDFLFMLAIAAVVFYFMTHKLGLVCEGFNDYTPEGNEVNFVLFYAEWCPHCKKFAPTWDKLTADLNGQTMEGVKVNIKQIDCAEQENKDKCAANDVQGYPTIKCFTVNGVEEYEGERSYSALETFLHGVVKGL